MCDVLRKVGDWGVALLSLLSLLSALLLLQEHVAPVSGDVSLVFN